MFVRFNFGPLSERESGSASRKATGSVTGAQRPDPWGHHTIRLPHVWTRPTEASRVMRSGWLTSTSGHLTSPPASCLGDMQRSQKLEADRPTCVEQALGLGSRVIVFRTQL